MFSTLTKRSWYRLTVSILSTVFFFSCQKELSIENGSVVVNPTDLTTKISSSVTGFVTDENDAAVQGAIVQCGTSNSITDKFGYFEAKHVLVVKNAACVTVSKPGYFKGIKTYTAVQGKNAFFRIKLIPKTVAGNINAATGGNVTLANGLSIGLPAAAVVNAVTNTAYTGTVNVVAYWINADAADLNKIMPGDLRGIDKDGGIKLLQTFGMAAVELTGASGELLQIAAGKKASLTLPIATTFTGTAPSSIPLWYFDENNGLWKEQGSAVKTGNSYVGEVSHFSYWNADLPGPYVQFDCIVRDAAGNPVPWAYVQVSHVGNNPSGSCHGYTDSAGFVSGPVPANAQLVVEIFVAPNYCGFPGTTQTFTTANSNISLGNIMALPNTPWMNITGTVLNCNNNPVTAGYLVVFQNNTAYQYPLSASGNFNFSLLACSGNTATIDMIGVDQANMQESNLSTYTINVGNNNVGNIVACNNNATEFFDYSVNNINYSITEFLLQNANSDSVRVHGYSTSNPNNAGAGFTAQNIAANSIQDLHYFDCRQITELTIPANPITVNITEYGAVGQFISGHFSGTLTGVMPPNNTYAITCNFRVRRYY